MSERLYRYAIIGTGLPWRVEGATGFGMANIHWKGFRSTEKVALVAISDLAPERMDYFLTSHEVAAQRYTDYHAMLANEKPEIVSICTWPHLHAEMTIAAAEAGVKVIHCEKPMATTWADCKRMKAAADANGALLSFNHQRRHILLFQAVRQAVLDGAIGDLKMIEAQCSNMYDWGTHWLDMMQFYNAETPIEWALGQIDSRTEHTAFGALMEDQAICHFKWANGVRGMMVTGHEAEIGAVHRLIGTEGVLEVLDERRYRKLGKGAATWETIGVPQGDRDEHQRTAADLVRQLDEPGYRSILNVENAIQHTEVIFATYESSRWRGRIDLPLQTEDSALISMIEAGVLGPHRT